MTEAQSFSTQRPFATSEDLTLPIVVYVLYLLALPTGGISLIVGLIMAYANRDNAGPAARSHYEFAIRTFWLSIVWVLAGSAALVVGFVLLAILIGFPILFVGALMLAGGKLWYVIRCVVGIVRASQKEAYANPDALLV